jgi:hypothetical protein
MVYAFSMVFAFSFSPKRNSVSRASANPNLQHGSLREISSYSRISSKHGSKLTKNQMIP